MEEEDAAHQEPDMMIDESAADEVDIDDGSSTSTTTTTTATMSQSTAELPTATTAVFPAAGSSSTAAATPTPSNQDAAASSASTSASTSSTSAAAVPPPPTVTIPKHMTPNDLLAIVLKLDESGPALINTFNNNNSGDASSTSAAASSSSSSSSSTLATGASLTSGGAQQTDGESDRDAMRKKEIEERWRWMWQERCNEVLVPISLNLDVDGMRIQDSFCWNLREEEMTPEQFARGLVEDLDLPETAVAAVTQSIMMQLKAHEEALIPATDTAPNWQYDDTTPSVGEAITLNELIRICDEEEKRKVTIPLPLPEHATKQSTEPVEPVNLLHPDAPPLPVLEGGMWGDPPLPTEQPNAELRVALQLHLTLNHVTLRDQFEWDLACESGTGGVYPCGAGHFSEVYNSPEWFAGSLVADLGLSREFQVAIAHSIREQLVLFHAFANRKKTTPSPFKLRIPLKGAYRARKERSCWSPLVYLGVRGVSGGAENETRYSLRRQATNRRRRRIEDHDGDATPAASMAGANTQT